MVSMKGYFLMFPGPGEPKYKLDKRLMCLKALGQS